MSSLRRSETKRHHDAARRDWQPSDNPAWLNEETSLNKIQPRLPGITIPAISSAFIQREADSYRQQVGVVWDRYARPQLPALREAVGRLDDWLIENGLVVESDRELRAVK